MHLPAGMATEIRTAREDDAEALSALELATWSPEVTPAPAPPGDEPFFGTRRRPGGVLVAAAEGRVTGYAMLGPWLALESGRHVLELEALAVDPACRGRGTGRRLAEGAIRAAAAAGARRLTLRVLGSNAVARAQRRPGGRGSRSDAGAGRAVLAAPQARGGRADRGRHQARPCRRRRRRGHMIRREHSYR